MEYGTRKTLESEPAAEPTAFTMRAIKDILAETGDEGLLMKSSDQPAAQPAQPAANAAPAQHPAPCAAPEKKPLAKRLAARLFGKG